MVYRMSSCRPLYATPSNYYPVSSSYYPVSASTGKNKGRQKKKKWVLADLSEWRKKEIIEVVRKLIKELEWERRWKMVEKGIKWFLILMAIAIFMHFGRILSIIEAIVIK